MKPQYQLVILTIMILSSCSQIQNRDGLIVIKDKVYKFEVKMTDSTYKQYEIFKNGSIKSQTTSDYSGNKLQAITYQSDGKISKIENYIMDSLHGESLYYYSNGQIRDRFRYEMGKKINHEQYNSDGSKRGEIYYYNETEYFNRVWDYDSLKRVVSIFVDICPVLVVDHEFTDTVSLALVAPLDSINFFNKSLTLNYKIDIYRKGTIENSMSESEIPFTNGRYSVNLIPGDDTDSLIVVSNLVGKDHHYLSRKMNVQVKDDTKLKNM